MDFKGIIKKDLSVATGVQVYKTSYFKRKMLIVRSFIFNRGFRAVFCYRISHYYYKTNRKSLFYIAVLFNFLLNTIEISPFAEIGYSFYIPHCQNIVISNVKIGNNILISQGVTLGKKGKQAWPSIGDNVIIGANALVLGDVTVGDNAFIGAGAVVIKDVPSNHVAVGVPAKTREWTNHENYSIND